jgi:regulator of sigma E protease
MTTTLSFLFVLGVLVFVHELGHFLVARWHGVRVITFSLGFGPKMLKFVRGGTEYCISVIPLGGYVKLAGETVEDSRTGAPDEFLSKSKWVRFQVYVAGPLMNLALAVFVLTGVLSRGADIPLYKSQPALIGTVATGSAAEVAGLRPGDRVIRIDGKDIRTWDDLDLAVIPKAGRELGVVAVRDGQEINVRVTPKSDGTFELGHLGIDPPYRPQITLVSPGEPADVAGLQRGDVILAVNGESVHEADKTVETIHNSPGTPISLRVERAGSPVDVSVTPKGPAGSARIGVSISPYEVQRIDPSIGQAFQMSLKQNWETTVGIGKTLQGLFTRETPVRQLMGPVGIAQLSGSAAAIGWSALFGLMAMISLNLGLLNLLPVPVLDGGHIAILAVEGLARRDLSIRVKERILMAGAAVMVLLMVTVVYNDIVRIMR